MADAHGRLMRDRRIMLGLSQRELAARAGVKQPLVAAIESGRRQPSASTRAALDRVLAIRPSIALAARRDQVRQLFARAGLAEPRVIGSVARDEDEVASDLDLLVEFTDEHDIVDLLTLEQELADLLTVRVDLVDARTVGPVGAQARSDAIAL